jgi:hypothetical protein
MRHRRDNSLGGKRVRIPPFSAENLHRFALKRAGKNTILPSLCFLAIQLVPNGDKIFIPGLAEKMKRSLPGKADRLLPHARYFASNEALNSSMLTTLTFGNTTDFNTEKCESWVIR